MAAVAGNDEEDYDIELEDDDQVLADEDREAEMIKQRKLLAAVAQQARKYQGLEMDEIEDPDEIMRQIYEENILARDGRNGDSDVDLSSEQLLQIQAESLAKSGMDPL